MPVMKIEKPDPKQVWSLFGPWLRRQREIAGKTRKQVAAAADIHPVQLARIEIGDSGTRKETLDLLIAELNLNPEEAYRMAGFWPNLVLQSSSESIEEALSRAQYFHAKGLSQHDLDIIRPILEALDRQIEELTKESPPAP